MAEREEYVVMFPFMAQSHIRPFLALAHQINQRKNCTTIFVNTPQNVKKLGQSLPPDCSVRLVEIPFDPSSHGLPANAANTNVLPMSLLSNLVQTSRSFKPAFRQLVNNLVQELGHPPLCMIVDMFFPWTAEVAHEIGVFHAIFNCGGAYGMACYHSLLMNLPSMELDYSDGHKEIQIPGLPEGSTIRVNQLPEHIKLATATDSWTVFRTALYAEWVNSDGFLYNTVEEFDDVGLDYYRKKINIPVWPVGPILGSGKTEVSASKESDIKWEPIKNFLDTKPARSVLYISFGSQSTVSASQMIQIAKAVEESEKNFIWVVRPPLEFDINSKFKANEWLPEGFEKRTRNRGLLLQNWAPQLKILSHESVSAFLSHCGWNSILESLTNGVPLLGWPMAAEQHYNAKFLEGEKVFVFGLLKGQKMKLDTRK